MSRFMSKGPTLIDLKRAGGVRGEEQRELAIATTATLSKIRARWLARLAILESDWRARFAATKPKPKDRAELDYILAEQRRLRRLLGLKPSPEEIRARTRERVRAFRERQRAAAP
jgi:hypothetical protein